MTKPRKLPAQQIARWAREARQSLEWIAANADAISAGEDHALEFASLLEAVRRGSDRAHTLGEYLIHDALNRSQEPPRAPRTPVRVPDGPETVEANVEGVA